MNGKVKGMGKFGEGFLDINQDDYEPIIDGWTDRVSSTETI